MARLTAPRSFAGWVIPRICRGGPARRAGPACRATRGLGRSARRLSVDRARRAQHARSATTDRVTHEAGRRRSQLGAQLTLPLAEYGQCGIATDSHHRDAQRACAVLSAVAEGSLNLTELAELWPLL